MQVSKASTRLGLTLAVTSFLTTQPASAQPAPAQPAPAQPAPAAPAAPSAVAARVNGQPILEAAVQRGLERVPPAKRGEARPELLRFLIDNLLIEQHLRQAGVAVEAREVDARVEQMRGELKKQGQELEKLLETLKLTEAELREHITADIRWEKYITSQATDEALQALFASSKEMFDGSMVRARHILLTPPSDQGQPAEESARMLLAFRQQVEAEVAAGLAKLPADADPATRQQEQRKLAEEAFSKIAKEKSACPSKSMGGDVGWFQRAGFMVEPFARAAFALQPAQMSHVVQTQFGYHLILATDRRPGKEVPFTEVKAEVREVFTERLHEQLASQLRQRSKIEILPIAAP